MSRKLLVLPVAFLMLAPLLAQNHVGTVQRVLQLDEGQAEQARELLQRCRAQIDPRRRQVGQLRRLLRELSDPTEIGNTHLQMRDLNQETEATQAECREQFQALLNPDQQETYARIRRFARMARRYERVLPAFRASGLLGGGR